MGSSEKKPAKGKSGLKTIWRMVSEGGPEGPDKETIVVQARGLVAASLVSG